MSVIEQREMQFESRAEAELLNVHVVVYRLMGVYIQV